jgi:hypothetical protein
VKKLNIADLKKKHPQLHLYYHDNGAWILYKKRPPEDTYVGEPVHDRCIIREGTDYDSAYGYLSELVQALCDALGITTESA